MDGIGDLVAYVVDDTHRDLDTDLDTELNADGYAYVGVHSEDLVADGEPQPE